MGVRLVPQLWMKQTLHSRGIRMPKRARDDAADVAQWRKGKLSGIGLLCELRARGRPKFRKRKAAEL